MIGIGNWVPKRCNSLENDRIWYGYGKQSDKPQLQGLTTPELYVLSCGGNHVIRCVTSHRIALHCVGLQSIASHDITLHAYLKTHRHTYTLHTLTYLYTYIYIFICIDRSAIWLWPRWSLGLTRIKFALRRRRCHRWVERTKHDAPGRRQKLPPFHSLLRWFRAVLKKEISPSHHWFQYKNLV